MATTIQCSLVQFTTPAHADGVPTDPKDRCFGKKPCGCGCGCAGCGAPPTGPACPCATPKSVRYATGEVVAEADDLHAGGFGLPWGHTRSFASRLTAATNAGNGYNWQVAEWSYLVIQDTGPVVVMGRANGVLWFDPAPGGGFAPRFSVRQTLLLDPADNVYQLIDLDGSVTTYSAATGVFVSRSDPAGNQLAVVSYTSNGFNFAEVQRTYTSGGSTTVESFLYTYVDPTAAYPLLSSVLLRRQVNGGAWVNVGQALYTYY